jgi:hypothetical protein
MLACCSGWSRMWDGGNQWSGYPAYLSFFRDVAQLDLDIYEKWDHYATAAIHGGPRMMHRDFCIVSDRPEFIHRDEQNRPHCETGPFCRWRDGWALWYVHGVRVTQQIVEAPETLTLDQIRSEENTEVRRVMMERFTPERFLRESNATLVCEDGWGKLWSLPNAPDEANGLPLRMVEMLNSTPEPDGSVRTYFERVPPTARTPLEGLAWQADVSPAVYAEMVIES